MVYHLLENLAMVRFILSFKLDKYDEHFEFLELLNVIVDVMAKYPKICRMWFGPKYFILLHDPEYVQVRLDKE